MEEGRIKNVYEMWVEISKNISIAGILVLVLFGGWKYLEMREVGIQTSFGTTVGSIIRQNEELLKAVIGQLSCKADPG